MALVTAYDPLFIHLFAMVFSMAVAAGDVLIGNQFPEKGCVVIVKILSRILFFYILHWFKQWMACDAEFRLVIDDVRAILTAVLAVTEEAIAAERLTMGKGSTEQGGIMAVIHKTHLIGEGTFRSLPGDAVACPALFFQK